MRQTLSGKVMLITGAARGIGEHTARVAAARGARLALAGLEPDRLESLAGELDAAWYACDVTDQASLSAAVAGTVDTYGGIDVVMANAGVAPRGTIAVGDVEAFVRTLDVNLAGVLRTAAATINHLIARRGYFLVVSSAAAFTAMPGMAAYCASKAGAENFGNALRLEVAHHGVRVGTAHPSWVDTDLVRDAQEDMPAFGAALRKLPYPLGSTTTVQRCAEAFVDAIEKRKRRVYVPRSIALVQNLRALVNSPMSDAVMSRQSARSVPVMEAETRALGRSFGSHTAGVPTTTPAA